MLIFFYRGFQDNDLPLDVKETLVDEEAVQLDVQCLEFLIRWRRDRWRGNVDVFSALTSLLLVKSSTEQLCWHTCTCMCIAFNYQLSVTSCLVDQSFSTNHALRMFVCFQSCYIGNVACCNVFWINSEFYSQTFDERMPRMLILEEACSVLYSRNTP